MAKWIKLPSEPFFYQKDQLTFLKACSERICSSCQKLYLAEPPLGFCPNCDVRGKRRWDRLTIIAGRRWGKSMIGSIAGSKEATLADTVGWACAPTNPKLNRYVIPAFQRLIEPEWVADYNSEFKDLRLKNGALIHFQTLEDPDQGRGQGLDWLWIDEVCELSKKHWEVIRPSLAGDTVAFFTTSPRSFDWVYEELYKPAEDGIPGYWACHAKTSQSANPKITTEFLAREKAQMSEAMYQQEYEADFVVFTGAVYGSALDSQILYTEEQIKQIIPEWPNVAPWRQVLVGIDTGADHPFGAVKLISSEKGLIVVGEYLERHKTFLQHANALKLLAASTNTRWGINRNERQPTIELAQHGIYPQPAENDIVAGTERVKSWLHKKQLWFVASRCPLTIKQMKAYRWADNLTKDDQKRDKEKVYKKDDELPDCVRYALMTWPDVPMDPEPVAAPRDISHLRPEMQDTIRRMRRIEDKLGKDEPSTVQDFWL